MSAAEIEAMMTPKLREQMKHSVSHCTLDGKLWLNPNQKEDLFTTIAGMRRYIVDSNAEWKSTSKKPANRDVAFILGKTVDTETDNLNGLLFSSKIDFALNNLFTFGLEPVGEQLFVGLHRLDQYHRLIFNPAKMDEESRPRSERTDHEFQEQERQSVAAIEHEKAVILSILGINEIAELRERKLHSKQESELLALIQAHAPRARYNWQIAVDVARLCYALLLIQQRRMRTEFGLANYRNVFGDVALVQNALFLRANVLSNDDAPRRMMTYLGSADMTCERNL